MQLFRVLEFLKTAILEHLPVGEEQGTAAVVRERERDSEGILASPLAAYWFRSAPGAASERSRRSALQEASRKRIRPTDYKIHPHMLGV